jgi:hypothetical protein
MQCMRAENMRKEPGFLVGSGPNFHRDSDDNRTPGFSLFAPLTVIHLTHDVVEARYFLFLKFSFSFKEKDYSLSLNSQS